jgi:two-component system alkaline phosphatase synthesis response regulator PhoP
MIFARKKPKQNNSCILIVEDNPLDREFFCQTLARENYKPVIAEVSDLVETAKKANPHLIIMNSILSGKKSLDLCAKLKTTTETKKIPILVFAEKGDKSNIIEYYSQNVECYLMKPISRKELISQLEAILK